VWELIGLFSFLLVNFYSQRIYTIKASLKTFIFSRISDMFIFIAFNLSILVFNTSDLSIIFLKVPFFLFHIFYINTLSINFIFFFTLLIALAGCIKGAQFFFHVWLPDAMEAPTPASALIHSSTLVIMGIYLIIRFSIIFEFSILTNYFLSLLGGFTIAFGAVVASFQNDIKKLVAYSTISQMGYLICGCGFCSYEEVIIYLIMHALNKAFLFIIVGYTVHFFSGNTDLRQMGGSYIYSFDIAIFFFTISLNLIGLPYTAGFYSKEFLLFQILRDDYLNLIIRATWLVSFCFTPFYMLLLTVSVLFGPKKGVSSVYHTLFVNNIKTLTFLSSKFRLDTLDKTSLIKYQSSLFTSRATTFLLLFF
jgi:NADH-quinone oxidoreductase subunit L